ncbi:MAG: dienelactone hydrolase family protein, partial [Nanoarchaeota archaeon]
SREIKFAIDFLTKNYTFKKLILFGHSTGAIDLALYAHKDKRITKIILGGAVSKLDEAVRYDFNDKDVHSFWKKGYIVYNKPNKWFHKKRLKKAFYDEFFTLDILSAIRKLKRPLLIIHGEKDEFIPVHKDPQEVYQTANKPKKLIIVKGADHSFSGKKHWKKVVKHIKAFIEKD